MEMEIARNVTEIEEEIRLHGHVEWRSKKNLDNSFCPIRSKKIFV